MPPLTLRYHFSGVRASDVRPAKRHSRSSVMFTSLRSPSVTNGARAVAIAFKAADTSLPPMIFAGSPDGSNQHKIIPRNLPARGAVSFIDEFPLRGRIVN